MKGTSCVGVCQPGCHMFRKCCRLVASSGDCHLHLLGKLCPTASHHSLEIMGNRGESFPTISHGWWTTFGKLLPWLPSQGRSPANDNKVPKCKHCLMTKCDMTNMKAHLMAPTPGDVWLKVMRLSPENLVSTSGRESPNSKEQDLDVP